ncbi:RHS repeat-associated core domain-containing protein [Myroides ceti]|uniref:RHS repeat-associated core domain-containing protein n=1 Tax=Paenimyroides ceti TaxID=395087 RepID=A0ABT8CS94_9FLAO|nr:RHS repeat-associated core domain-containing protein [Paenimyroides ceti]MDN3707100.1 RHS repeat-associated core domain-containing protein [Paenimyroides ceti]
MPFGESMVEHNQSQYYGNQYKFNGKELDSTTGMYYYGARYYEPRFSIFVSVDPLAEKYTNYTPYNYTLNNPIMFVDPDGREPEHIIIRNTKNKDGSINMYITIVGKVIDLTSNNSVNVSSYIASAKSNLEKTLSGNYKTSDGIKVNVSVQVQLTQAKDIRDIGDDDHVIGIVDSFNTVKQFGVSSTNAGIAYMEGNVTLLKAQYLNGYNTLEEHEFGHLFGLDHKSGTFMSSTISSNKVKTEDQQKQMFERFRMLENKKMRNIDGNNGSSKNDLKNLLRESRAKYETNKL